MSKMTPANLPDMYARVVAKRPELAVPNLKPIWDGSTPGWRHDIYDRMMTKDAAALILEKWVEALPVGVALVHETTTAWGVDGNGMVYPNRLTPLEALASFYLEYQP